MWARGAVIGPHASLVRGVTVAAGDEVAAYAVLPRPEATEAKTLPVDAPPR